MTRYAHVGPVEVHPEIWRVLIRRHNGSFNAAQVTLTRMIASQTVQVIRQQYSAKSRVKLIQGTTVEQAIEAAESVELVDPKSSLGGIMDNFMEQTRKLGEEAAKAMNEIVKNRLLDRLPKP